MDEAEDQVNIIVVVEMDCWDNVRREEGEESRGSDSRAGKVFVYEGTGGRGPAS